MQTKHWAVATAAALCALGTLGATTATAAPAVESLYAPSAVVISKTQGASADAPAQRAVTLRCLPVGGDHPAPEKACAALREAGGDPAALPRYVEDTGRVCTREYRPVTVSVQGMWDGRRIDHAQTFSNSCELEKQTASVYAF